MSTDIDEYARRFDAHLQRVAQALEQMAIDELSSVQLIDRVSARAKDPGRFAGKAQKRQKDGGLKYPHPLTEVQDQIGLRVVVLYADVILPVSQQLLKYFRPIERQDVEPESDWEFGYFGRHFILALPGDVVPSDVDLAEVPDFFELQVKTLFQHAWSEANHDLGYKPAATLDGGQRRLAAFAAAQAWGADRAFTELRSELESSTDKVRGELTPLRNPGDEPSP